MQQYRSAGRKHCARVAYADARLIGGNAGRFQRMNAVVVERGGHMHERHAIQYSDVVALERQRRIAERGLRYQLPATAGAVAVV